MSARAFLTSIGAKFDEAKLAKWLVRGGNTPHVEDFALAFACSEHDEAAVRHFEKHVMPLALRALRGLRLDDDALVEDVLGWLRFELFAREAGPLISTYSGRSDLGGWLRAIVLHEALRRQKKKRREVTPEALEQLPMPDVELSAMRGAHGAAFTRALDQSFRAMPVQERNLLRQSFLDGLSIDVLSQLYGVHRATAARRVVAAREALVVGVRERLRAELRLDESGLDSLITLSNLDESLAGLLRRTD